MTRPYLELFFTWGIVNKSEPMPRLVDLATKISDLRDKKGNLTAQLKEVSQQLEVAEQEMLDYLIEEGMDRVDVAGKGTFFISNKRFFKIADREAFLDFLHEQGDTDLLTVQHQTLNAYAKEILAKKEAEGKSADDEDFNIPGLEFITKTEIRVKK